MARGVKHSAGGHHDLSPTPNTPARSRSSSSHSESGEGHGHGKPPRNPRVPLRAPRDKRDGVSGEHPVMGSKDAEGTGASPCPGKAEGAGAVQPGEKPQLGGPSALGVLCCPWVSEALLREPAVAPEPLVHSKFHLNEEELLCCEGDSAGTGWPERVRSLPQGRYPRTCAVCSGLAPPEQGGGTGSIPSNLTHSVILRLQGPCDFSNSVISAIL